jgi:hypothetical protein
MTRARHTHPWLSSFWFVWPLHVLYVSGWSFAGLLYLSMDEYVVLLSFLLEPFGLWSFWPLF